ncbi:uncharacterized protein [Antedon mediterranea]|uniref:uncharacterized protein n=1 Tax=Antedon mediterranea TaxID=105859 RepID=UPI003AF9AF2C
MSSRKKKKKELERFKSELKLRDLRDDVIEILINEGFSRLSDLRGLEVEDLDKIQNLQLAQYVILKTKIKEKWSKVYDMESSSDGESTVENVEEKYEPELESRKRQKKHKRNSSKEGLDSGTSSSKTEDHKASGQRTGVKSKASTQTKPDKTSDIESGQNTQDNTRAQNPQSTGAGEKTEMKSDFNKSKPKEDKHDKTSDIESNQNTQDNTYAPKPQSTRAGEKPERMKSDFNTSKPKDDKHEKPSTEHVSDIEDVEQSNDLIEHFNCNLAKKFFKQKRYDKMEEVLVKVDRQTKSAYGRGRFATKISQGCNDFAELHDCINHQMTDVKVLHELACAQFLSLAESHREILKEMDMDTECTIFTEWASRLEVIFMENSPLEYGSLEWKTVISKTEEVERFFSSLPIPARNVSKSYILLMLQFICRMWLYRNHLIPEDQYGLLLVATFALPLCESELVTSKYFCAVKHDMYVHAAITIGCNISNMRLAVKDWYDEFYRFTKRCEQLYDEGLKMNKDIRSEDDTRNLDKFTSLVQSRLKTADLHFGICQDDYIPDRTTDEHHRLTEQNITTILSHWNDKSYKAFCQSITDAENQLKDTGFRLQVGSWLSPRYKDACNVLNGSYKQLDSSQSLLDNLRDYLMELVVDCRRLLKDLKIYSNDSMTDWVEVFSRFCSADDCVFGSSEWHAVLDRAKTTVENMPRGANIIGRTITQMYVQLFVELMKKAFLTYQQITPKDRLGHVRLALINMTMVKSPLLSSKWYSSMRFNIYLCGLRSIASCLLEAEKPNKDTFYQEYKNVKENIDSLIVESRKFKLPFASKEDLEKFIALHKDVKQNMTGRSHSRSKVIASDPDVSRLVETAVAKYQQKDYDQMTKHLDDGEKKDGSCDVRLAFAGNISTEFHLVVTFSNNIPEDSGLSTVEETTQKYLLYLANDHQNVMKCMNERLSKDMKTLTADLFTLPNVMPGTHSWIQLERDAKKMVQYFESLTKNGQSVTKCYILLFLTVIHNFIATRNRLRRPEHFRLLPFILPCRLICESKLLESNAWIKTKFEVYEVVVLTTGAALGTGQIPCDLRYPDYWKMYDELVERGKQCGIELTNANKQDHMDRMRRDGLNLCNGTEDRMCITAALLYHRAGCYKGLMLILNAANQTSSVQNIRMNFTMRVSHTFEKCVDYHNKISNANTYEDLVEKSYHYLSTTAKDFLKFVKNMGETTSNDLVCWVDEVFQARNGKPELYPVLEIDSVTEKCNMASVSIQRMSEEARCIAQTYLEFFMSFIMNFVTRRYQLHVKNVYKGGLKMTLAVIMLCKDVLVTSNFSVKQKLDSYGVAATYMTEISGGDVWTDKMEFVLNELPNLEQQRKQFDEICRKRERQKKGVA